MRRCRWIVLILDPGLGFAKRATHSLAALAQTERFAALGRPLLVGPSRKSFLTSLPAIVRLHERDWATAAAVTAAVLAGAHIVRVHRVPEMVDVVRVADAIRGRVPSSRLAACEMTWLSELLQRPPVTFWDVIDIMIVSVIVYEVLKLIRGTHAVQMAMGIALLVGLFYVSRGAQLETLNWLIRNVVGYVVFAAIVLMQGDIRRALVHIGRAPFFRLFRRFDRPVSDDDTVQELVMAATTLSAKRTGALIVIERSIGLRNYIESGIPLDARLTYDLLVSIFQSTSPLHDGAVIVQGDRVAAAACFLPLTVNPRLSRELGSRHRAAIGVTEENDAIAIVVSEETGVISLVMDGDIERSVEPDRPAPAAGQPDPQATDVRPAAGDGAVAAELMAYSPFRNIGLKFLSICIAALLWLVVAGDRVVERSVRVPDRIPEPAAGSRDRRRPSRGRRCPAARLVRCAGAAVARRYGGRHRLAQCAARPPAVSPDTRARSTCPTASTWCKSRRRRCRLRSRTRLSASSKIRPSIEGEPGAGLRGRYDRRGSGDGGSDWSGELAAWPGRGDDRAGLGGQRHASRSRGGDHRRRGPSRSVANATNRGCHGADVLPGASSRLLRKRARCRVRISAAGCAAASHPPRWW